MSNASQRKFRQMLELLLMLNNKFGRNRQALAAHFNCSVRTINRYINTFKEVGFVIENKEGYLRIDKELSDYKDLSELLHFSEDESLILTKAIESINADSELKEQLKKKLYALYNFDRVATPVVKKHNHEIVKKLIQAISEKHQVELIQYRSANSQNITNRIIEPFDFTQNYTSVWAYEAESDTCKTFKINRISNVRILPDEYFFAEKHKKSNLDVFRMNGKDDIRVKLNLSLKAYNLLIEEYPRSELFTHKLHDNLFVFETTVFSLYGIGRFVLGLPNDIEIIYPQTLKNYVAEEMHKALTKVKK